jgi:transcriptional regulator GlxA family with amidase domain
MSGKDGDMFMPSPAARQKPTAMLSRRLVILATPTAQSLEIAGPIEVFATAVDKLREVGRTQSIPYRIELVSCSDQLNIKSWTSGLVIRADRSWKAVRGEVDTLLVAGGMNVWTGRESPALLRWIRKVAGSARRVASVCTGAFLLAEAGLLDHRRVATHWYFSQKLQDEYPRLRVDPEPLLIKDGKFVTAAGVTSAIDLALSIVDEDYGSEVALRVSRALVLFIRRYPGQSQFSTALAFQTSSRIPIRELPMWILENLGRPLNVDELSARVAMSARNFSRVFAREFGVSPAKFVDQLRVDSAKRFLAESQKSLEEISVECGFGSVDSLNRAFRRLLGKLPSHFRVSSRRRRNPRE